MHQKLPILCVEHTVLIMQRHYLHWCKCWLFCIFVREFLTKGNDVKRTLKNVKLIYTFFYQMLQFDFSFHLIREIILQKKTELFIYQLHNPNPLFTLKLRELNENKNGSFKITNHLFVCLFCFFWKLKGRLRDRKTKIK